MTLKRQGGRTGSTPAPKDGWSRADADIPIPSVEDRVSSPAASDDTPTTTSNPSRLRTPSVSVTPPVLPSNSRAASSQSGSVGKAQSESLGLDSALNRMRLSSPGGVGNLSDVVDAIDAVARGSDSRSVSLAPDDQTDGSKSTTPQRARRRRSSSRIAVSPHDVKDEELPKDAFHSPSFQKAFMDAKDLMSTMGTVLGSSSLHSDPDSTMQQLYKQAGDLACFNYPSTRTVGFVGDSGVGKSSLLNSLLDFQGLARTSNSGEACTCVVTEYHYHEKNGFDIEIQLFSLKEIEDQLLNLLQSYRHFHLHKDEMDPGEREEMKAVAERARDTFRSLFRDRMSDENFLLKNEESSVLQSLNSWAADARPSEIASRECGLSLETCSSRLMQLSSEPASKANPAKWPFIRKIRIFLNAHILSKGLVLVDLPGLRDLNSARRAVTERFLLECDEIFVVCNIGRAATDAGVEAVFELARQAQLSNVGIICTRSDDIQADEAKKDWKGQKSKDIQKLMDAVFVDKRDVDDITSELADYESEEDPSEDERDYKLRLHQRERMAKSEADETPRIRDYLIRTRNSTIDQKLRDQYREKVSNGDLRVFCVSNKNYWENRTEPRDAALPHLQLSGILEVRKYCISIVANSQRRLATRYMRDEIPALFAQVELWVQSGAGTADAERKEVVRRTLDELESRLKRDLKSNSSVVNNVAKSIKQDFLEQVYEKRCIYEWSESAMEAGYEWSGWHHASYSAFCRQYGNYRTGAAGKHNWNEEAIDGMVRDLKRPWIDFRGSVSTREADVEKHIEELTDWSIEHLISGLSDVSEISEPLIDALVSQQALLLGKIEEAYEQLGSSLKTLGTYALSGIETSLMGEYMDKPYRACNRESGAGSDSRRKAIINGALANDDLFSDLMRDFNKGLRLVANETQEKITMFVGSYLASVHGMLQIILSENVALESEQDPAFRSRVGEAVKAKKTRIREIITEVSD
ncbi:hypothetical protein B0J13DRAFT_627047 [Dactylonectria estremocensis]|uniref:Nuclear GTPase SLIP-GC n=1 Tax=Dactylonectria estremocensis TaxID=1079267 RepID=A0A9P9E371_9HYPO|nr:hypothetical protein B0J13DRAFT_627047 [Dactylonectria estremocensis]